MMKNFLRVLLFIIILVLASFSIFYFGRSLERGNRITQIELPKPKPLEKYSIENLSTSIINKGVFTIENMIEENDIFTSYLFDFKFHPNLKTEFSKSTKGQINIPSEEKSFPIVLMVRGYVDQEIYETGGGTRKAAARFAENGFITVAPDFLGYAQSDPEAQNIFESRFQTYTTVLSLLKSLDQIDRWDGKNIFIWGHSNGGQIALIVLEITTNKYPTTLWAPVSKPFPYSILYYTDEAEDKGKLIRRELAKFEELYDVELFSLDNYLDRIQAPLQIHQGTNDDAVPGGWSDGLVSKLEKLEKDIIYYKYPANHNMVPAWDTVVNRDVSFFIKYLKD